MKRGDIVICVTDEMYGQKQPLKIGDQYIIVDVIEMSEKKIVQICDKNKKNMDYTMIDISFLWMFGVNFN